MKEEAFRSWLSSTRRDGTVDSRVSNCRIVQDREGDLDIHFDQDKLYGLLTRLTYSKQDEREKRPAQHRIPIKGNVYNGTATLKAAVSLYKRFRESSLEELHKDTQTVIRRQGSPRMEFVATIDDVLKNIKTLESYRNSTDKNVNDWYQNLICNGICFWVYQASDGLAFAPSRFIGYKMNSRLKHDANTSKHGRDTNDAINRLLEMKPECVSKLEGHYRSFCKRVGIEAEPTGSFGRPRKYWLNSDAVTLVDNSDEFLEDISEINENINISTTEKEQLIKARLGQGHFRDELIGYWKECPITKCAELSLLRASHIKPWRYCENQERLDKFNGLLLTPNLDAAFDRGYVTFSPAGQIIISPVLSRKSIAALGIDVETAIALHENHLKYLVFHRENIFKHDKKAGS